MIQHQILRPALIVFLPGLITPRPVNALPK